MIVTVPALIPVILPELSTVAILGSLLLQISSLSVAFSGSILATNCSIVPADKDKLSGLNTILLTFIVSSTTFTTQVEDIPLELVTVIVTLPFFIPVTTPLLSTVAILSSLLVQVITSLLFVVTVMTNGVEVSIFVDSGVTIFNTTFDVSLPPLVSQELPVHFIL